MVGSMDGRLCQYAAQISLQPSRVEMVQHGALQDAVKALLESFKRRNKTLPATIVVFRDGVADGQFDQVIGKELPAIKGALELMGYIHDSVKIAIVICQKSHHTRFFYQEGGSYINPCPGELIRPACLLMLPSPSCLSILFSIDSSCGLCQDWWWMRWAAPIPSLARG